VAILSWISFLVLTLVALTAYVAVNGYRKLVKLEDILPLPKEALPKISIIFSALNEEENIEAALQSLLAIDYPDVEIIAINDRSTDKTPEILNRLAPQHDNLRVVHIDTLPDFWLGKNHALHQGAQQALGKYIIFTDADVIFDVKSLQLAVSYCEQYQLDHLTLIPTLIAKNHFLQLMLVNFTIAMLLRFKPWRVQSSSEHFMGIGAFNMVKRSAYEAVGRHSAIALTVLDDIGLGKLIKDKGFTSSVLIAKDLISVEWYKSPIDMFRGLQKNIFAAFEFQITKLILASVLLFFLRIWPWYCLVFADGIKQLLAAMTLLIGISLYSYFINLSNWSKRALFYAPIGGIFELIMLWSGCLRVIFQKGIFWRGTFYSLAMLKQHQYKI
jgi:glycosyltransferase involved in cell wall biosynthesis